MKKEVYFLLILFSLIITCSSTAQKRLAEFPFDIHNKPVNVNTAIGFGTFTLKVTSQDVVLQSPIILTDTDEITRAMYFKFKAGYNAGTNNISIALAPKAGSNVRITHIEFRMRFGSNNNGNAGIFITKDPTTVVNTQIWTCGNNSTFNAYKDFVVPIPASELNYSASPTDSIRFVMAHGTNTLGMYFDNLMVYGIVNEETNPAQNITIPASYITKELAESVYLQMEGGPNADNPHDRCISIRFKNLDFKKSEIKDLRWQMHHFFEDVLRENGFSKKRFMPGVHMSVGHIKLDYKGHQEQIKIMESAMDTFISKFKYDPS